MRYNLVFDLDDTLFDTNTWISNWLVQNGHEAKDPNSFALPKSVPKSVADELFSAAEFMLKADPLPHFHKMKEFYDNHDVLYCTHRGYVRHGLNFTVQQLCQHLKPVLHVGDAELERKVRISSHVIASEHYPCKLEYLDSAIGQPYVLVDDNPKQTESELGTVIVFDKPWNKSVKSKYRIASLLDLPVVLRSIAAQEPRYAKRD